MKIIGKKLAIFLELKLSYSIKMKNTDKHIIDTYLNIISEGRSISENQKIVIQGIYPGTFFYKLYNSVDAGEDIKKAAADKNITIKRLCEIINEYIVPFIENNFESAYEKFKPITYSIIDDKDNNTKKIIELTGESETRINEIYNKLKDKGCSKEGDAYKFSKDKEQEILKVLEQEGCKKK